MAIKSQYIISAIAILAGVIILWRSYGAAEPPVASPPTTARPIATPVVVGSGLVLTPIDRNLLDAYPVFEAGATMPSAIPDELVMPITPTAALPVPTEAVIPQPIVVVTAPAVVPQPQPANPEPVIIAPPAGDNTGNTAGTDTNGNGTVSLTPTVAEEIATSVTVVASVTPPATATATPTTTPTATPVTFGVELRVEGTSGRISILYSTPLETERLDAVRLPWSLSLRAERGAQLSVFVDNASELGDVSCTILVENVVIVTVVDLLPFGEVECAAIVP